MMKKDISANFHQKCLILCSKILINVLHNLNLNSSMKDVLYEVRCLKSNEDMILALTGQLSNCLMNLTNSGDSTGFEPMTTAMPVQCSNQLSYEVTQLRACQFVGLMFSRERNVV